MKFDKKYVHFVWDDILIGKKVFFADGIENLKMIVENENNIAFNNYGPVKLNDLESSNHPFIDDSTGYEWTFVYYDPSYVKVDKGSVVTERDLAKWLARGKGEWTKSSSFDSSTSFKYLKEYGNYPIDGRILIRRWDDEEWVKPSKEYMEL